MAVSTAPRAPTAPLAPSWQPSLLDAGEEPAGDPALSGARRRFLGAGAWIDVVPGWVRGADQLFGRLIDVAPWAARERVMFDAVVTEPRLSTGTWDHPPEPCPQLAGLLGARYGLDLSAVSANLYRDGRDSVAWHGDRLGLFRAQTVVAIVSLGEPRRLLLRPHGGGPSIRLQPGHGDLVVMGGTCQRTWDHAVPKCAAAGPRVSLMFREPGVF